MKATEARGVTATKPERPRKEPVPYSPENLHLTKEQFIEKRKAEKAAAKAAAEEAGEAPAKPAAKPRKKKEDPS
jgi:hypothetical protein